MTESSYKQQPEQQTDGAVEHVRKTSITRGFSNLTCFSSTFRHFDKDYNQQICFKEFQAGLQSYGIFMAEEQELALFRRFDKDGWVVLDTLYYYLSFVIIIVIIIVIIVLYLYHRLQKFKKRCDNWFHSWVSNYVNIKFRNIVLGWRLNIGMVHIIDKALINT